MDQLKQHALEIIERNVIALVEADRKNVGNGVIPVVSNPAAPWTKIPDQNLTSVNYVANGTEIPIIINPGQGIRLALINYATPGFAYVSSNARLEFFNATTDVKVGEVPIISLRSSNAPLSPFPFDGVSVDGQPLVIPNVWNVPVRPRMFGGTTAFPGIWFDDSMAYQLVIMSGGDFQEERRLHNELVDGVKIPTARLTTYLAQASTEAASHQSFVMRREDYAGTAPTITFEIKKKLVESYLATSRNETEVATALKKEAFELVERDVVTSVEAARRATAGEPGQLHNELVDGVKIPTARLTTYIAQANSEATAQRDFVQRKEEYKGTPPAITYEIRKKLVESYLATSRGESEMANSLKKEAFELIERDIVQLIEKSRRDTAHPRLNRLHNELPDGLKMSTDRINTLRIQAFTEGFAHQSFLRKEEEYREGSDTPASFEFINHGFASSPEWFEVQNTSNAAVDMTGWRMASHIYNANVVPPCILDPEAIAQIYNFPNGFTLQPLQTVRVYSGPGAGSFNNPTANPPTLVWSTQSKWNDFGDMGYLHAPGDIIGVDRPVAVISHGACEMAEETDTEYLNYEIEKKFIESYIATAAGDSERALTLKKEALGLIERDVVTSVQTQRSLITGDLGRLHNEVSGGLLVKASRMSQYNTTATTEAQAHQSFVQRQEDYKGTVPAITFEVRKKLVESYLATARGEAELATALKKEAFDLIARDIEAVVEKERRDSTHPRLSRLHNEIVRGLLVPSSRLAILREQAVLDAHSHRAHLRRLEEFREAPATTNVFSFTGYSFASAPEWVELENQSTSAANIGGWRVVSHTYNNAIIPPCTLNPDRQSQVFTFPAGFTLQAGQRVRVYSGSGASPFHNPTANPPTLVWSTESKWDNNGDIGYLHTQSDIVGVDRPIAVLTHAACQTTNMGGLEDVPYEIEKLLVESYLHSSAGDTEKAAATKRDALELIQRDVMTSVENQRSLAAGDVGRLHNEIPGGLSVKTSRMQEYLNQANDMLASHWLLVSRNEDLGQPLPLAFEWEAVKMCVQSLVYQSKGELEATAASRKMAFDSIESDVRKTFVNAQKTELVAMLEASQPDTFGNYVARFGLDLAETGLSMPTSKIKRLINSAEEHLFTKGRWHGTTKEVSVSIAAGSTGEIVLPAEVDVPVGATFEGSPIPIFSRELEFAESGPGYQDPTVPTVAFMCLIDRGERVVSGVLRRVFFLDTGGRGGTLRLLSKIRFAKKTLLDEPMQLKCYSAIKTMTSAMQSSSVDIAAAAEVLALGTMDKQLGQKRGNARTPVNGPADMNRFSSFL
jgi:hypothetical protein